ncbi:Cytochrome P450 52A12 [Cytospora mali]|uniref:Cytochrome P450 52A12 n=1 Tax=Cytospora mali TaxID=578113 RepID=A0A194VYQ0_CYTMA|nr:Cytochrome P450 52A12 [Valsa mali]
MAHFSLPLALIVSVSYVVYYFLNSFVTSRRRAAKARELGCKEPPFEHARLPWGIDIIRASLQADKEKLFPDHVIQRAEKMGAHTYKYSVFGQTNINTNDPRNIQTILATNFGTFDLGPQRFGAFWPMLGNGIFTQHGSAWKHSRELMRPQFTRDQVGDLELEEQHVRNMMSALQSKLQPDGWTSLVDLQVLFYRLTLDSATEFLLGESADSQLQHIPGYSQKLNSAEELHNIDFATAFDLGQSALSTRARLGPMSWAYNPKWFRKSVQEVNQFMDFYVKRALDKNLLEKEVEQRTKPKYVFLEALAEQTQDPVELRSQLMHILLAGRDTTASMLGWLFFSLARDPARYKKLRDIIIEEFGTFHQPKEITFAKLKSCQYLQHCNNETLRLYAVVPVNSRQAYEDTTLPTGGGPDGKSPIFVPKGTSVDYSVHAMHRRRDLWGPDADQFVPERWQNRRADWSYLPFNGGPRICLGQQFALTESSYVTVRMIQRFDVIENLETDPVVRHNATLTNCSANGVKVKLHAASD